MPKLVLLARFTRCVCSLPKMLGTTICVVQFRFFNSTSPNPSYGNCLIGCRHGQFEWRESWDMANWVQECSLITINATYLYAHQISGSLII